MQKIWTRSYVCNAGINFLIYAVYFMMMLWTVSYSVSRWDVSISMAGLASGLFMAGALSTRGPVNKILGQMSRRTMLIVSTGLFFLLSIPYLAPKGIYLFMFLRFLHGVAFGAATTAVSTVAAALTPVKHMNRVTKYYTMGVAAASAAGPFLALRFIDEQQMANGSGAAIGMALAALVLSLFVHVPRTTVLRRAKTNENRGTGKRNSSSAGRWLLRCSLSSAGCAIPWSSPSSASTPWKAGFPRRAACTSSTASLLLPSCAVRWRGTSWSGAAVIWPSIRRSFSSPRP